MKADSVRGLGCLGSCGLCVLVRLVGRLLLVLCLVLGGLFGGLVSCLLRVVSLILLGLGGTLLGLGNLVSGRLLILLLALGLLLLLGLLSLLLGLLLLLGCGCFVLFLLGIKLIGGLLLVVLLLEIVLSLLGIELSLVSLLLLLSGLLLSVGGICLLLSCSLLSFCLGSLLCRLALRLFHDLLQLSALLGSVLDVFHLLLGIGGSVLSSHCLVGRILYFLALLVKSLLNHIGLLLVSLLKSSLLLAKTLVGLGLLLGNELLRLSLKHPLVSLALLLFRDSSKGIGNRHASRGAGSLGLTKLLGDSRLDLGSEALENVLLVGRLVWIGLHDSLELARGSLHSRRSLIDIDLGIVVLIRVVNNVARIKAVC